MRALGAELEALFSYRGLSLLVTGTAQNVTYADFEQNVLDEEGNLTSVSFTGNNVPGTPPLYYTVRGSYDYRSLFDVGATVQGGLAKWLDNANNEKLPGFTQVNAYAGVNLSDRASLSVLVSNIFNAIGLTEGNPRAVELTPAGNLFFARPIMGRSALATFRYRL